MLLGRVFNLKFSIVLLVFFQIAAFSAAGQTSSRRAQVKREIEIKLFFSNPKLPAFQDDCRAGEFVRRTIPATRQTADAALKLLFAGPTREEQAKGMEVPDELGKYYLNVTIKRNGTAVVNFRPGAEKHLYVTGGMCDQDSTLTPIVETLKQFPAIKRVDYAINGKIIEDWDI